MAVRLGVPESVAGIPLARRLAWVTGARLLLLLVALGALLFLNVRRGFAVGSSTIQIVVATLAAAFALAGFYAAVLRLGRRMELLALAQLVFDQATTTAIVYVTGGAASGATSFYGLACLLGAFLVGGRGAAVAGASGIACYAIVAGALYAGWLKPPPDQDARIYALTREELWFHVFLNVLVVIVVLLLSSYLAERLRTAGGRLVEAEARAESAERMAVLGRLAAGLAHEIRNPLGSIAGSVQLLRANRALSEDDRKLCEIIQSETARLNDLVTDMMDVARPRKPEMARVNVAQIAREVVELASKSGRALSDVTVTFSGDLDLPVRGDAAQLRQLVWNLVRNGVQASSAGGTVRVRVEDHPKDGVVLVVEDDGVGIDPATKDRLFDAFFTTRAHGTGIGLAVVKRIADDHGFAIEVSSERGRGARFRVVMGAKAPAEPESPSRPPRKTVEPPPGPPGPPGP
jgi:two-component system sensor histidine kinase HydH